MPARGRSGRRARSTTHALTSLQKTRERPPTTATAGTVTAGIHAAPMMARRSGAEARQPVRPANQI
jgi:hypothetical protein